MTFPKFATRTSSMTLTRSTVHLFFYFLLGYGLVVSVFAQTGADVFERLHLALDVSNAILSFLLAIFLLAEQYRLDSNIRTMLAMTFMLAAGTELLHALVGIEWQGRMAWISLLSHTIRPATWPPSAYLLPIGLALLYRQIACQRKMSSRRFTGYMLFIALLLFTLAFTLPKYYDTGILGIQRPTQVPLGFRQK